jgi:hypothetical protein
MMAPDDDQLTVASPSTSKEFEYYDTDTNGADAVDEGDATEIVKPDSPPAVTGAKVAAPKSATNNAVSVTETNSTRKKKTKITKTAKSIATAKRRNVVTPATKKKEKQKVVAEDESIACSHEDWMSFQSQEIRGYDKEGCDLHQVKCAAGKCSLPHAFVTPALGIPVHHCKNVRSCQYAYCHSCYSALLQDSDTTKRKRRAPSHNKSM